MEKMVGKQNFLKRDMKGPLRTLVVLLQLMLDLHPVFAKQYLHEFDSDSVVSCETRGIEKKTVEKLQLLDAKKYTEVRDAVYADENINTCKN